MVEHNNSLILKLYFIDKFLISVQHKNTSSQGSIKGDRHRNLGISRGPLKSQAHQSTSLFTSAVGRRRFWPILSLLNSMGHLLGILTTDNIYHFYRHVVNTIKKTLFTW